MPEYEPQDFDEPPELKKMTSAQKADQINIVMQREARRLEELMNYEEKKAPEEAKFHELCTVCWKERIQPGNVNNVELDCGHSFCTDCFTQACKIWITKGQVDKLNCLEFSCQKKIYSEKLKQCLPKDLYVKYERFKRARALEGDPLIRFCPKPHCGMPIRAEGHNQQKLTC